jgi:hypothetical protein
VSLGTDPNVTIGWFTALDLGGALPCFMASS